MPPRPPVDPYPYAQPTAPPQTGYGSPYGGGQPDPFAPTSPYPPASPPQSPYPSYPAYPPYAGQPTNPAQPSQPGAPYDPGRTGYAPPLSPFEQPNPYEPPPAYGAPPVYGQHPFDPGPPPSYPPYGQPAAPPPAPATGNGNGAKQNGQPPRPAARRRRRRSNRTALVGVGALGLIILLVLGTLAFRALFGDDDGDDGNGGDTVASGVDGNAPGDEEQRSEVATAFAVATAAAAAVPTAPPVEATATAPAAETPDADEPDADAGAAGNAAASDDEAPAADADENPPADDEEVTLESFLPGDGDVPDGFALDSEDEFTEEVVAVALGNEEESAARLDEWSWREGGVRTYVAEGEVDADATSVLIGSAHRLGSSSAANEALTYFADAVAGPQNLDEIEVETIGDETLGLSGQTEAGANQVILYVRSGPYLLRVAGTSAEGDPQEAVVALAQRIVEG